MALTHSIRFDEERQCYRVRFRGKVFDQTKMVPRKLFAAVQVDSRVQSDRGRRIAERWAVETAQKLELEVPGESDRQLTLAQLFELRHRKNPTDAGAATRDRWKEMEANLVRLLGHRFPSQIDDADALDYRNNRAKEKDRRDGEPIRNRTIKNELAHLKTSLSDGYQWRRETGMFELNLFKLPVIRRQATTSVQLTNDEIRELLAWPHDHDGERLRAIFILGLVSMLRVDNLMHARREWWDLKRRWRHIPAEAMKGQRGEKRELSVPISEWEAGLVAEAIRRSPRSPWLFPNFNGRPSKWPTKTIRKIAKAGKLRYFSAHDLRRTGMSILEEHGRSKVEIQWLAGHALGGDVTDDYVARAAQIRNEDRLREAVAVFDAVRPELDVKPEKKKRASRTKRS